MYRIVYFSTFYCLVLLAISCKERTAPQKLPYYNSPDFTALFIDNPPEIDTKIPHQIAPFSLVDQLGHTITDTLVKGKIHVANFIFTSCISICPVMTDHMKAVAAAFGDRDDFEILSYSVTPWIDSVDRLKSYADKNKIHIKNWHFLTGDKAVIYHLARQSYFAEEDLGFTRDSTEFLHTEHILLIDRDLRIRGIYNGTLLLEINQMIEDIKSLMLEA